MAVAVAAPAFAASPPTNQTGTCFDSYSNPDLLMVGPINTLDNALAFLDSRDGTCIGSSTVALTVVSGETRQDADKSCRSLGRPGALLANLRTGQAYLAVPPEFWFCAPP